MKKLIGIFILGLLAFAGYGQSNVDLRGDSIRMYKNGGNAELVLRNGTRDTIGVLYNLGNGITVFKSISSLGLGLSSVQNGPGTSRLVSGSTVSILLGQTLDQSGDPSAIATDREIPIPNNEFFIGKKSTGKYVGFWPFYGIIEIANTTTAAYWGVSVGGAVSNLIAMRFGSHSISYNETTGLFYWDSQLRPAQYGNNITYTNSASHTDENYNTITYLSKHSGPTAFTQDTLNVTPVSGLDRFGILKRDNGAAQTYTTVLHNTTGNIIDENGANVGAYYSFSTPGKSIIYTTQYPDIQIVSATINTAPEVPTGNGHRVIINNNLTKDTALLNFGKTLPNMTYTEALNTGLAFSQSTSPTDYHFDNYMQDTVYGGTASDKWTQTAYFIAGSKTSTPLHFGIGIKNTQIAVGFNFGLFANLTNNTSTSSIEMKHSSSSGWSGTTSGFNYSVGDLIKLEASENENIITGTLTDVNTGYSVSITKTNPFPSTTTSSYWGLTVGNFSIFPGSGNITLKKWTVTNDYDYADVVWVGTSISEGSATDSAYKRYFNIIKGASDFKFALCAKLAAYTADFSVNATREIFGYKPKYIVFDQSCNDAEGGDTALTHALYKSIRNKAVQAGIRCIHVMPLPQGATATTIMVNERAFIQANFGADIIFNDVSNFDSSGVIKSALANADQIHLSTAGHRLFATDFIAAMPGLMKISNSTPPLFAPNVFNPVISMQVTLVSGVKAITIPNVTANCIATVSLVSESSAGSTAKYKAVCTTNTVTVTALTSAGNNTTNTADGSTVNVQVDLKVSP